MSNEYEFQTTIHLAGVEKQATCSYISKKGLIIPFALKIEGRVYPVDNWKRKLTKEAREDCQSRRAAV